MNNETVLYDRIRKNPWNPNVMTARVFTAELESILEFGFIDPVTVRENAGLEIIDGEHRWRGFGQLRDEWHQGEDQLERYGIKVTWKDGNTHPLHQSLAPLFEKNEIPISNLGVVPDADAKKLTLILNETRGKSNTVDVAALLAEIAAETGVEELGRGLPYSPEETAEMLKLCEYDWNAVTQTAPATSGEPSKENADELQTFTVTLPLAAFGVYQDATEKITLELAEQGQSLPKELPLAHGLVIEKLALHFLDSL